MNNFWTLKLKFAYGSIKTSEDLIDVFPLTDPETDLPSDVSLERDSLNLYTLRHKVLKVQC